MNKVSCIEPPRAGTAYFQSAYRQTLAGFRPMGSAPIPRVTGYGGSVTGYGGFVTGYGGSVTGYGGLVTGYGGSVTGYGGFETLPASRGNGSKRLVFA